MDPEPHELLRQVFDADEPIVIRVRHELEPYQQRLLVALGAGYIVDPVNGLPCAMACGRKECEVSSPAVRPWCRIGTCYRKAEDGSEFCSEHGWQEHRNGDEQGRELLDRMDAGEPLAPVEEIILGREPEAEEATPAGVSPTVSTEAGGAAEPSSRSSKVGPVKPAPASEEEPPAGDGASTTRGKWTRETAVAAIREVGAKVGRTPSGSEMRACGFGGVYQQSLWKRLGATWQELVAEAGFEPRVRGVTVAKTSEREPQASSSPSERTARVLVQDASAARDESQPPSRPEHGRVKVPGTGLTYRSPMEAYAAAVEIEADGDRVAEQAVRDGNEGKAEQARDVSRALAEKIRCAAAEVEQRESGSKPEPAPLPLPDPAPQDEVEEQEVAEPVRLLVTPDEMRPEARAVLHALVAGLRAFADTLEAEVTR